MNAGTQHVYNGRKPIRSIEDLKGLKIRMMGNPVFVDTMNAIGGNGVAMGFDQPSTPCRPGSSMARRTITRAIRAASITATRSTIPKPGTS